MRSFIKLAFRHCCDLPRPTEVMIQRALAGEDIATIAARRGNLIDLREPQFRLKVQQLWVASHALLAVI